MKKLVLCALVLLGCSKKSSAPPTATLIIEVRDTSGSLITTLPGKITVYLYTSLQSFGTPSAAVASQGISGTGRVTFQVAPASYYYFAQGKCGTNTGSDSSTNGTLTAGITTILTTTYTAKAGCTP